MKRYYIGIDLGGTNTRIALLGKRYDILEKDSFPTTSYKRPDELLGAIRRSIPIILKRHNLNLSQIIGIGIGIAGLVDAKRGVIYNLINIRGWRNFRIKRHFEDIFGVPTYVDNDVNLMALAELYKGAGGREKNLICITLGTGVGGGIIIDGRLYRGSTSSAGEIGHIPINEEGPRCNCGGRSCIESYVGNRYIVNEIKRMIKKSACKTILKDMVDKNFSNLTPELVYKAARSGDRFSINFWKAIGTRIGIGIVGVINLLDPDKIIIGGGIAEAGRFLFDPIRKTVMVRAMEIQRRHVKIVKAKLGQDAGLIGAAILVKLERNEKRI